MSPTDAPARESERDATASANVVAMPQGTDKRLVKASFNLPADELESLKRLAARRNTTATQVVRQSLATETLLQRIVDDGGTIMAKVGRRVQELIFSHMQLS